ncbi:ABC transporter A family member 1 [Selaginella moellendorffii]|uniref:ABC transporter A family member 1 n=1 Tax=Selaginella moellendorffii TaxID=88036 RepID=UPI000D1D06A2|nr:ABC transporter A family member 1 [Selaginella moellendorffii]|eukprot:XP_024515167.1 ABC transporter A family member 1 [Selaginella moellendorffii]
MRQGERWRSSGGSCDRCCGRTGSSSCVIRWRRCWRSCSPQRSCSCSWRFDRVWIFTRILLRRKQKILTLLDFAIVLNFRYIKEGMYVGVGRSKISPSFEAVLQFCEANGEHIAFVPESEGTSTMVDLLSLKFPLLQTVAKIYKDEETLHSYIKSKTYGTGKKLYPKIKAAVVFFEQGPCTYDYSIRLNHSWAFQGFPDVRTIMDTTGAYVDDLILGVDLVSTYEYGYSGFLTLQQVIDSYLILLSQQQPELCHYESRKRVLKNESHENVKLVTENVFPKYISVAPFPTREYTDDEFQSIVKNFLGILYLLAFLYPVSRLISCSVLEKEKGIKEGMLMMGLEGTNFYVSWFIIYMLQFAVSALIIVLVTMNSIFAYSSMSVVFVYFFLFGLSAIALCFLISVFFTRAKTATAVGTLSFLAAFFPYYVVVDTDVSLSIKLIASLLSPTAFALGTVNFADYERGHVGVRWSNIWKESSGVSFLLCMVFLAVDALLYLVLAWYFNQVLKHSCGHLTCRMLWNLCRKRNNEEMDEENEDMIPQSEIEPVEFDQQEFDKCVHIKNLRKVFVTAGRECTAVNSLSLSLCEGQILALLGHNGAGKSTTIGMLVGLVAPTSGDAFVLGKSIKTDMMHIRKQIGVCPQNDLLFQELTVREHLLLFGSLKSVDPSVLQTEVDSMISEIGLLDKSDALVGHLSGGMKRKLSVALALLGGSKVVILDEPTSGMDPYSMRLTWRLLKRHKKDRIILLTTHSMDEADVLGDRIAIMSSGNLRCCGSSLFLKHRYGVGYTLTLVKGQSGTESISEAILRHVPSATLLSDVGSELSYRLPLASTSTFHLLFEELEAHATLSDLSGSGEEPGGINSWDVESYGISVTTLEEVFLRVASGEAPQQEVRPLQKTCNAEASEAKASCSDDRIDVDSGDGAASFEVKKSRYSWISSCVGIITRVLASLVSVFERYPIIHLGKRRSLFGRHFRALFKKRGLSAMRDKKTVVFQLLVPSLFLFLGLLLLTTKPHPDQPSVTLTTSLFNPLVTGSGGGGPIPFNLTLPIAQKVARYVSGGWIQKEEPRVYKFPDSDTVLQNAIDAAGPSLGPALVSMSEYLMTSFNETYESRYGAVVMDRQHSDGSLAYAVLHNTTCQHAAPTYINVVNNAILKMATNNSKLELRTRNHPLPMTVSQMAQRRDINAFSAGIIVNVAYSFIPASFAVAIVKEREVKAKHQQLISGVSLMAYWISTYVWDMLSYLLPAGLAVGLFFIFGMDEFIGKESILATSIMMVAYGPAIAASTYCLTFFFTDHSLAQNVILLIHFFSGLILMVVSFIMGVLRATKGVNRVLKNIFRLSPGFCLADGLASLALRKQSLKPSSQKEPFAWNTTGASITYLCCESILYFLLVLAMELLPSPYILTAWCKSCFGKWRRNLFANSGRAGTLSEPFLPEEHLEDEDLDVARERRRVQSGGSKDSVVKLVELRKTFPCGARQPPKVAVDALSFAVDAGECFGFLGTNGAGKTTTLSMLCGEFPPSEGNAYIVGHDVWSNPADTRQLIGYCPQFDALLDLLTVREHLELYANIKAVPEDKLEQVVQEKLTEFDLWGQAHKTASSLSGGNKRKLSVAIAMVADPPIVILDEPSTGMDPVARRFMWDVITRISTRRGLSAVILTTHSMAEAQALCTRIGIMAAGRLRCLGSPQHLKSRFGNSLELEVKAVTTTQSEVDKLSHFVLQNLPDSDARETEIIALDNSDATLSETEVTAAAFILGNEQWGQALLSGHASVGDGALSELLLRELSSTSTVQTKLFCEWWLAKDRAMKIDLFIRASFPGASLLERNGSNFRYQLPYGSSSLARVFGHMEHHRASAGIAEYNVGQATLEAIFNAIAAHQ